MTPVTLYHEASKGGFKQWSIWLEADNRTVTVEWGLVGKTLQRSSDTAGTKGKFGSKAFKSEEMVALDNIDRQIRKKREEGYRDTMDPAVETDYLNGLDKSFVPAKPMNDYTYDDLMAIDAKFTADPGNSNLELWMQRKRDGQRHLVLYTRNGDVKIYSRRLEDMTGNFPRMADYLKGRFPNGTILDGEMVISNFRDAETIDKAIDNFKAVSNITKSKPERAREQEILWWDHLQFMVFDLLYYDGRKAWNSSYRFRYNTARSHLSTNGTDRVYLTPSYSAVPFDSMAHFAGSHHWEGLVIWQPNEATIVRQGGKPKRVNCIKWKPIQERDVIATGWEYGSGERSDVVGVLKLAEYDTDGNLRECGKCGSGFDVATAREALTWTYPCVVSIEFDKQESTGKFRFPVFLKKHEDKTPDECVGPALPEDDE